jgi:hypothetical protein
MIESRWEDVVGGRQQPADTPAASATNREFQ